MIVQEPEVTPLAIRDRFGAQTWYYHLDQVGRTVRDVLDRCPGLSRTLDPEAIQVYLDGWAPEHGTVLREVRAVPGRAIFCIPGADWNPYAASADGGRFRASRGPGPLRRMTQWPWPSAAGWIRRSCWLSLVATSRSFRAYVLAAHLDGYCEVEGALATAKHQGVDVRIVDVFETDYRTALPEAIRGAEVPFFNLHPVSRFLLARAMVADGVRAMVTGDGADQLFAGAPAANYLPIMGSLCRHAGLELRSPSWTLPCSPTAWTVTSPPCALWPPAWFEATWSTIRNVRLTPPIDLGSLYRPSAAAALAEGLGLAPPDLSTDRGRVLWTTLTLLVEQF